MKQNEQIGGRCFLLVPTLTEAAALGQARQAGRTVGKTEATDRERGSEGGWGVRESEMEEQCSKEKFDVAARLSTGLPVALLHLGLHRVAKLTS